MTKLFDLTGRIAIVTGSAQGMGRAMAMALAEAGADLVLLDRNAAGIEATAHDIRELGCKALPIAGDVTDTDHIETVFATVDRELGRVDILGNVAGEARAGAAEDMTLADIRTTFHNLVISRYYTCQLAGRRMLAQGRGSIISIGSIAGVSSLGRAQSVYGMAMAAVIQMTRRRAEHRVGRARRAGELHPAGAGARRQRPGAAHGGRIRGCAMAVSCAASRRSGFRGSQEDIEVGCRCCWRRTRRTGSPARSSRWMAATWR